VGASFLALKDFISQQGPKRPKGKSMTAWQKIVAGGIIGLLWLAAIISKHFWTDIDTGAFQLACGAALSALGIHSAMTATGSAVAQGMASLLSA
jgi:hypothetical protein